jgi:UDP-N-acetylmuramoyl-tripeptide--D-alanyl-D-alanine ligase
VAVGRLLGVDWGGVERGLLKVSVDQRLAVRAGAGGRRVIDDSYNSSPVSLAAALEFLAQLPGRKAAILGDMLELGPIEAEAHREAGRLAARTLDVLVAVGDRAALMAEAARDAGLAATYWTDDPVEAAALARSRTAPGDWILVKGSRGLRLERAVQALVGGEG